MSLNNKCFYEDYQALALDISCFHINIDLSLKGKCGSLKFPSCRCYSLSLFLRLISDNVKFGKRKIVELSVYVS